MEELSFFMPMRPPTVTAQEQKTLVRNGKPVRYDTPEIKEARARLAAHLGKHVPDAPLEGGILLEVKWCFDCRDSRHADGEPRTTRPDTDNLQKLLKDEMTKLGYWHDDAQVFDEHVGKWWSRTPGIWIRMVEAS